jgi:gliding motility-associated-like protein
MRTGNLLNDISAISLNLLFVAIMKSKILLISCLFLILSKQGQSQIVVDNSITLDEAIAILLGPDVDFFNVTFNGDANQLGSFDGSASNVGLNSGIIMGTGDVTNAIGPNNSSSNSIGGGNSGASDPDLDDLDNLTHNDAAILEFDFIATGESVSFDYVWASEEYPEFTGSGIPGDTIFCSGGVADIFGFFLSGPGINGAFTNSGINIATIPNTTNFVSILSLNAGCDGQAQIGDLDCNSCQYYIHNGDGFSAPFNETGSIYVQYDGLTVVLTAQFTGLQCGETYHIKLAVADVSDTVFDSAVFLKEGSFDITGSLIDAIVVNPIPSLGNNTILEGCIDAQFVIHPPGCQSEPLEINLFTTGSATSGVDYIGIPATLTIDGADVVLPITSIADQEIEGLEDITVYFVYLNADNVLDTASATLNLTDYQLPSVTVDDIYVCGGPETAVAQISNGFGPYNYNWSSGSQASSVVFNEGSAGEYALILSDFCGAEFSDDFTVFEPLPFYVVPPAELCLYNFTDTIAFGGGSPYVYTYNADTLELVAGPRFTTVVPGVYEITIADQCGSSGTVTLTAISCETKIPNVFTPNGDGINETFYIDGIEQFPNSTLTVWNRWGKVVYESPSYNNSWTAKDEVDGIYYYVLQRNDGVNFEGYVHRIGEKP